MKNRWYDCEAGQVIRMLESDGEKGLSAKEARVRLKEDGKNVIHPVVRVPVRGYLVQVLSDLATILLLATAMLALVFEQDVGALAMMILIALNYGLTLFSYTRSQRLLEDFGKRAYPTAKVVRAGKLKQISGELVVQGDLILLAAGDVVPCDCRLLEDEGLTVMESGLFDTDGISKKDSSYLRAGIPKGGASPNMVYASTVVVTGRAKAIAVETGPDTVICRKGMNRPIAACHQLDVIGELKKISRILGVSVLVPVFIFALSTLFWGGEGLSTVFLTSLSMAVAAMPEMYTAFAYVIVTFGMYGVLKPYKNKKGAFIKNPSALPALSKVDCLLLPMDAFCLERSARLAEIFEGSRVADLSAEQPDGEALRVLRYALVSTGLYGTERLAGLHARNENVYSFQRQAILDAGQHYDLYNKSLEEEYPLLEHLDRGEKGSLFETSLVHFRGQDVVVLRGEPEAVVARCTGYYKEGKVLPLDEGLRGELLALAGEFSRNNRQPVAIATKFSRFNNLLRIGEAQSDLIFEGFLAIEKPFLKGAPKEVLRMRDAGVRLMVYTSDEGQEHWYRARALGVVSREEQAVRFSGLKDMGEEIFRIRLKNYTLLEGFNGEALRYTVSCLKKEYGYNVAILSKDLTFLSAMYEADATFSVEEGRQLVGSGDFDGEVTTPVWSKGEGGADSVGCQALNHLSDVILPPVNDSGEGGINGVSVALRCADTIYHTIGMLLRYLSFTGAMRFAVLLFSMGSDHYLTAVQGLLLGLIFDLAAVFVLAMSKGDGLYLKNRSPGKRSKKRGRALDLIPFFGSGMVMGAVAVLGANVLQQKTLLSSETRSSFVFCALLFMQIVLCFALWRWNRSSLGDWRRRLTFLCYPALALLILILFFAISPIGQAFTLHFIGFAPLGVALLIAFAFLGLSELSVWIAQKVRKRTERSSPTVVGGRGEGAEDR